MFLFTKGKRISDGKLVPKSLDLLDYLIHFYHAELMTRRGDVKASQNVTEISRVSIAKWNEVEAMANIENGLTISGFSFSKRQTMYRL